jgi:hypothetical protein
VLQTERDEPAQLRLWRELLECDRKGNQDAVQSLMAVGSAVQLNLLSVRGLASRQHKDTIAEPTKSCSSP